MGHSFHIYWFSNSTTLWVERLLYFVLLRIVLRGGAWVTQSIVNFSSGHELIVCEFEPCVGLCADRSEPWACFGFCVSLCLSLLALDLSLSLYVSQKQTIKKFFKELYWNVLARLTNLSLAILLIHCKNHLIPNLPEFKTHGIHHFALMTQNNSLSLIYHDSW